MEDVRVCIRFLIHSLLEKKAMSCCTDAQLVEKSPKGGEVGCPHFIDIRSLAPGSNRRRRRNGPERPRTRKLRGPLCCGTSMKAS